MNKKNGFTLVELLAVIVVLGLILVIAVPKIMNVIKDSKKGVLASSARLIANSAENIKLSNDTMGISTELQCSNVSEISASDYEDCTIEFVNGEALVTIIGKGRYEGLSVCKATSEDVEVIEGKCPTESGGGSVEITDSKCFAYEDVLDDTLGVQGISITGYSLSCPKDVIILSEIDDKPVIAIKDYAFTDGGDTPNPIKNDLLYGTYEVSTLEGKFYNENTTIEALASRDYFGIGITSVIIPNSVTTIGERAFYGNELTSVIIPNSVTTIEDSAFHGNELTSVTLGNSVTTIGSYAFEYNQLTSVTIPNSVTLIGRGAFNNNKLRDEDAYIYKRNSDGSIDNTYIISYGGAKKDITIPNSVTAIGDDAFSGNRLTSVTIPDSVTTIGEYAFSGNQLTSVTIPNSVTTIGHGAFYKGSYSNPNLTSIVNTTGRSFDWGKIITGTSGTSSITGTYNDVNVTAE